MTLFSSLWKKKIDVKDHVDTVKHSSIAIESLLEASRIYDLQYIPLMEESC